MLELHLEPIEQYFCYGLCGEEHVLQRPITYENLHLIWKKTTPSAPNRIETMYAIAELVWKDDPRPPTWLFYMKERDDWNYEEYGEFFPSFQSLMDSITRLKHLAKEICDDFLADQQKSYFPIVHKHLRN
jgi:hypothetical protein